MTIDWIKNIKLDNKKDQIDKIFTIFTQLKQIIEDLANEQTGGISFANFDLELGTILKQHNLNINSKIIKKIIKAEFQQFYEWLTNTKVKCGQISYYVTLNLGLANDKYSRFVLDILLTSYFESDLKIIRPNIVFKIKNGINLKPTDRNYKFLLKSFKCTAKKMIPTYLLCDNNKIGKVKEFEMSIVGCRTRVYSNINGNEGSIGRGNAAVTTINLVNIALELLENKSTNILENFIKKTLEMMVTVKEQLLHRFYNLLKLSPQDLPVNNKYVFTKNKFINTSDMLKEFTLSIGFIGIYDVCQLLFNKNEYEAKIVQSWVLKLIKSMRELTDKFTNENKLNFSLIGIAGESVCHRFLECDQKNYSNQYIKSIKFYTNSFHVNVKKKIGCLKKSKLNLNFISIVMVGVSLMLNLMNQLTIIMKVC